MTWSDVSGYFDWEDLYDEAAARFPGGLFVEVGTFVGRSLCYLGSKVKPTGGRVIGVDHCRGNNDGPPAETHLAQFARGTFAGTLHANVIECGLEDVVNLMVMRSEEAAWVVPYNTFHLVFIDGSHDYESVSRDIRLWKGKVRRDGWFAGHDIDLPGVKKAVSELLPGYVRKSKSCWLYEKK